MILTLKTFDVGSATLGKLYHNGELICRTLEPPYRNNEPCISCIPEGGYNMIPHDSPKFGKTWYLEGKDVGLSEGKRTHILFHKGNKTEDTMGCILPGFKHGVLNSEIAVLNSEHGCLKLFGLLGDKSHYIEIYRG